MESYIEGPRQIFLKLNHFFFFLKPCAEIPKVSKTNERSLILISAKNGCGREHSGRETLMS